MAKITYSARAVGGVFEQTGDIVIATLPRVGRIRCAYVLQPDLKRVCMVHIGSGLVIYKQEYDKIPHTKRFFVDAFVSAAFNNEKRLLDAISQYPIINKVPRGYV